MNWTRAQLKSNAKLMFKKNYWMCVLAAFILAICTGSEITGRINNRRENYRQMFENIASGQYGEVVKLYLPVIGITFAGLGILVILFTIFVGGPVEVGSARFFLHNIESNGELNDLKSGFENQYLNIVKVQFLRKLYIALWSLLLIIPGVVKGYEYYLVPYLLSENPNMSTDEALSLSRAMMDGEKWNTFVLEFSFILWELLSGLTWGLVGIFWVNPWRQATDAELYTAIKTRYYGTADAQPGSYEYNQI